MNYIPISPGLAVVLGALVIAGWIYFFRWGYWKGRVDEYRETKAKGWFLK